MTYIDLTKNQHYLSQIEQRLNSSKVSGDKIYSFILQDRESCTIKLDNEKGTGIHSNLSFSDLYTFQYLDNGGRKNFERAFGRYEQKIASSTFALLDKLKAKDKDILNELFDILCLKFLNFIRNPHNIRKVLNTFGALAEYYPLSEELLNEYRLLESRNDGGLERICRDFDVSKDEYFRWMKVIFLSLIDIDDDETMLENLVKALIEDKKYATAFIVYGVSGIDSDKKVLLSDRSYVDYNDAADGNLLVAFNLTSDYFIKFGMTDVVTQIENYTPPGMDKGKTLACYLSMPKEVKVYIIEDNEEALTALANYNMNAVYQCHRKVFCAVPFVFKN